MDIQNVIIIVFVIVTIDVSLSIIFITWVSMFVYNCIVHIVHAWRARLHNFSSVQLRSIQFSLDQFSMTLYPAFINTLRPRQNGRHFADDTFNRIFMNENVRISIKISFKFVPKGLINNIPALV